MKWIAIAILLIGIVLCAGCVSTQQSTPGTSTPTATLATMKITPNLIGVWSGNAIGHSKAEGFSSYFPVLFNISDQKGPAFSGRKEYLRGDGKAYYENFSGIITQNGEIYESDEGAGFGIGKITGPDSIEINYLEEGPDTKAYLDYLTRQKTTSPVPVTTTIPDVIGIWTGMTYGHSQTEGFRQHDRSRYNISKQEGYAFSGSKEYIRGDGKTYYENFSGIISNSGEISMADNPRGYNFGKLTGNDTMELNYVEDGPEAKTYLSLFARQKS